MCPLCNYYFFFFNDTATTEIYTLSLHDALPIYLEWRDQLRAGQRPGQALHRDVEDRKSTRLNSSHGYISYAVFCLKKKKILNYSLCKNNQTAMTQAIGVFMTNNVSKCRHSCTLP